MEEECGLEELYGTPPVVVPQTLPTEPQAWQRLVKLDYGSCVWDTILMAGRPMTAWLAREKTSDVLPLPDNPVALWKLVALGGEVQGHRVFALIFLIQFFPLNCIYETWFNFYGADGALNQEAFGMLQFQSYFPLLFLDHGPIPVRQFGYRNEWADRVKGIYQMCACMPPWTDEDFNIWKARIEDRYEPHELMGLEDLPE